MKIEITFNANTFRLFNFCNDIFIVTSIPCLRLAGVRKKCNTLFSAKSRTVKHFSSIFLQIFHPSGVKPKNHSQCLSQNS